MWRHKTVASRELPNGMRRLRWYAFDLLADLLDGFRRRTYPTRFDLIPFYCLMYALRLCAIGGYRHWPCVLLISIIRILYSGKS